MRSPTRPAAAAIRRAAIDRVERVAAQETWIMGRVLVEGTGELFHHVTFPVTFGEKPLPILGGGEVDSNVEVKRLQFPRAHAVVASWDIENTHYYKGATLAITVEGSNAQRLWVSYAFVGSALTNVVTE